MAAATNERHNRLMLAKLAVFSALMFGFGYAMVPLYEKICQVTGLNNLLNPDDVESFVADPNREVRLEFAASAHGAVSFSPLTEIVSANPGATYSVVYEIRNLTGRELRGQAIPSYAPARAQRHFKKIECFCFNQMTLKPHEKVMLPVVFSVDPALEQDMNAISLHYTFFEIEGA